MMGGAERVLGGRVGGQGRGEPWAVWSRFLDTAVSTACLHAQVRPNLPSGPQLFAVTSAVQGAVKAAVWAHGRSAAS